MTSPEAVAPRVSVVIPAYNASLTVSAAIESVRAQSLSDFEIIVVDDGSTDDTGARVAAIDDPRLRVIHASHDGPAQARNRGIEAARGEFITFLDADDLWTADKLESQVAALEADPGAGAVYSWTAFVDEQGRYLFAKRPQHDRGDVYGELLVTFFLASGSNVLARTECVRSVGRFDGSVQPVEDWEYWLRAARTHRFAVVPKYQVLYRFSSASASAAVEKYQDAIDRVSRQFFADSPPELRARRSECLSNASLHACLLHLARTTAPDRHQRAGRALRRAIALRPASLASTRIMALVGSWLALGVVPADAVSDATQALLRAYGRWMLRTTPALREFALESGLDRA